MPLQKLAELISDHFFRKAEPRRSNKNKHVASANHMRKGYTSPAVTAVQLNESEQRKHMAGSRLNVKSEDVFPFLKLPAELREQIYLFAVHPITPVDTAAIPGTADRVVIPTVAQLSRQTRTEALHVLFSNRPVEISLHSKENLRRAGLWIARWRAQANSITRIFFTGCLERAENDFFHITLQCSDEAPHFRVSTRLGASDEANTLILQMKDNLLHSLEHKVQSAKEGQKGRLSGGDLIRLIGLINVCAKRQP